MRWGGEGEGGVEERSAGAGGDSGETGEGVRKEEEGEGEEPRKRRRESSGQEKVEKDDKNEPMNGTHYL